MTLRQACAEPFGFAQDKLRRSTQGDNPYTLFQPSHHTELMKGSVSTLKVG